jgi:rhodanese-related sulfurtransferase
MLLAGASRLGRLSAVVIFVLLMLYALYRWQRRRQLIKKLANARITVDDLFRAMGAKPPPVVFDIRSEEKRKLEPYIIPGAVFADERQLSEILDKYPRDRKLVIYCSCPNEISAAWMAKELTTAGFVDVLPLLGGIDAWRDSGHPIESLVAAAREGMAVQITPKPV